MGCREVWILPTQTVTPLGLLGGEHDGVIAGTPSQNAARSFSGRFPDWVAHPVIRTAVLPVGHLQQFGP